MDSVQEKLTRCFAAVFPQLGPEEIPAATAENTAGWDSVAQVTLLSAIGEEFGIEMDFEAFEGATSFSVIALLLTDMGAGA